MKNVSICCGVSMATGTHKRRKFDREYAKMSDFLRSFCCLPATSERHNDDAVCRNERMKMNKKEFFV